MIEIEAERVVRQPGRKTRRLGRIWRIGAVAMVLATAGCDSPEDRVQRHYERGLALVAEGTDQKAALEFRNALRIKRDHGPARLQLAKLQERGGNIQAAARTYRQAAEADPADPESRWRLAQIVLLAGDAEEARRLVEQALAIAPQNADVLATSAALAMRTGDTARGTEDARKALAVDPRHVGANMVVLTERIVAGDRAAALEMVDRLLEAAPLETSYNLAKLELLARGSDDAATRTHFEAMIARFPDVANYRRVFAAWLYQNGDMVAAERELRTLADSAPDSIETVLTVVRFVREKNGDAAGRAELEARIGRATTPVAAAGFRRALAQYDIETGDPARAKATLRAIAASDAPKEAVVEAQVDLARLIIAEGDRQGGRELVDAALRQDAEHVGALTLRARLAIEDYRPQDAIADIRLALNASPRNPQLLLLEATAHERDGNLTLAGERLAAAARASDYDPATADRYVQFLIMQGDLTGAESVLVEISRRHPANRATLGRLAEVRLRLRDWSGAERAAAALRAIEGGAVSADQITAAALQGIGRTTESLDVLRRVAARPEAEDSAMQNLVVAYARAGAPEKAAAFLDDVLARRPDNVRALVLRADLHLVGGDVDQARALVRRAIDIEPGNPTGHLALANLELRLGRAADAEVVLDTALATLPESLPLRFLLAQVLEQRGAINEAIEQYRFLYARDPSSPVYANNLASMLAEYRETDPEAIAFAGRVAQRLRGYDVPHFKDTYGWVMFLTGNTALALENLSAAAAALPNNPIVRYHAGRAYAALNKPAEARGHLEAALAIDPGFPKADSARNALAALAVTRP